MSLGAIQIKFDILRGLRESVTECQIGKGGPKIGSGTCLRLFENANV
jgi:hypothetical protein